MKLPTFGRNVYREALREGLDWKSVVASSVDRSFSEVLSKVHPSNVCSLSLSLPPSVCALQPCSKESIHQLVLNAENLVREEVFLQQQQQVTSSRRHHSHPQKQHQNYHRQSSSPVLLSVSPPHSAKCNGASSNYRSDAATAVYMAGTMKVNCTPTKKSASGSSPSSNGGSSARKCDQLKIKLVQVRHGGGDFFPLLWTLEDPHN